MSFLSNIFGRLFAIPAVLVRYGFVRSMLLAAIHAAAMGVMFWTEYDPLSFVLFLLTWGLLNFLFLFVLWRPIPAAAASLAFIVLLVLLSQFKHEHLFMTVNFVDLMIVDTDTVSFLLTIMPGLARNVAIAAAVTLPLFALFWWFDSMRVRLRSATLGCVGCLVGLSGLSFAVPSDRDNEFYGGEYVSKFARSGAVAVVDYFTRGLFDAEERIVERLRPTAQETCQPRRPPHIVMVFDESSFDITLAPNIKVPADYRRHFSSFDGKHRSLVVEAVGGPSWFTEYNVLTGLSVRSYGRFADFVTRIAAGRVERGLPRSLQRCGYKTFSLYSWHGAFLSARRFQQSTGIERFLDAKDLGVVDVEPDSFYFNAAANLMRRELGEKPMFFLIYTQANHFPWSYRYRPDLLTGWRDPGNSEVVDEYLRRQAMSAADYAVFVERLKRDFPGEPFLIVRFGDHQPNFAPGLFDRELDDSFRARRIAALDPRFLTTYYAIDTINFTPPDLSTALDTLDAPYLPLVVLEAAGLPLDASFAEQKRVFQRCRGLFYRCNGGAEARRFNRLLIDAGLIKGL